jgi:hypothetical protein
MTTRCDEGPQGPDGPLRWNLDASAKVDSLHTHGLACHKSGDERVIWRNLADVVRAVTCVRHFSVDDVPLPIGH